MASFWEKRNTFAAYTNFMVKGVFDKNINCALTKEDMAMKTTFPDSSRMPHPGLKRVPGVLKVVEEQWTIIARSRPNAKTALGWLCNFFP